MRDSGRWNARRGRARGGARPNGLRRAWRMAVTVVMATGVGGSLLAASWWEGQVKQYREDAFDHRADAVAGTVGSLLQRQIDVTDGALTLLHLHPDSGTAGLQRWFDRIEASGRYPGVQLFGYVESVPAAESASLLARIGQDLVSQLTAEELERVTAAYDVTLDPTRTHHCLPTAVAGSRDMVAALANRPSEWNKIDMCDTPLGPVIDEVRDKIGRAHV